MYLNLQITVNAAVTERIQDGNLQQCIITTTGCIVYFDCGCSPRHTLFSRADIMDILFSSFLFQMPEHVWKVVDCTRTPFFWLNCFTIKTQIKVQKVGDSWMAVCTYFCYVLDFFISHTQQRAV